MRVMGRQYHFEWRTAVLAGLLLPLLLSLGFWQLSRARENRAILAEATERQTRPAVDAITLEQEPASPAAWHYLPILLDGHRWREEVFLLDNQKHQGVSGYDVVGIVELKDGRWLAVNRGWLAGSLDRKILPAIPPPMAGAVEVGELYCPALIREDADWYAEAGWPKRIARFNLPSLERVVGRQVFQCMARLKEGSPSGLVAHWPVVNVMPEKNVGYAIQWFAMASALVIFYLALSFRREENATIRGHNGAEHE